MTRSFGKMDTVIFVSPVFYFQDHSNIERWKSTKPKPGYVPILNSDLAKFEQTLKQAHGEYVRKTTDGKEQTDKDAKNKNSGDGNTDNSDTSSLKSRFVDLQSFLPISLEQQLHTVCLGHVPLGLGVKGIDKVMEKLEQVFMKSLNAASKTEYIKQWSYVDCVNSLTVYVSFREELAKDYGEIIGLIQQLLDGNTDGVSLFMDENTSRYVSDLKQDSSSTVDDSVKDEFWQLVDVLKAGPDSNNTHDKGSSVEYTVDMSTLSDLPSSSLDQLCKDIIEFRTRVITLEKEKRNKELIEAEKRRRQHLKQIFDKIKNAEGSSKSDRKNADDNEGDDDEEDDDDDDDDEDDNEYQDEKDDYEVEQKRLKAETETQQNAYDNLVHEFQNKMLVEYSSLRQELHCLQNYETQLHKNRGPLLKEFMHLASDPHYDHHRAYKETEQKADEQDRALEAKELEDRKQDSTTTPVTDSKPNAESAEPKIKLALRQQKQEEITEEEEQEEQEVPEFLQKVELLKKSGAVDELVKEFLGVYEPDLVGYIFDNIREHQSRETLEKELAETFDDDSPVLVDRIWAAMETDA